jgi:hypothetical protein
MRGREFDIFPFMSDEWAEIRGRTRYFEDGSD